MVKKFNHCNVLHVVLYMPHNKGHVLYVMFQVKTYVCVYVYMLVSYTVV